MGCCKCANLVDLEKCCNYQKNMILSTTVIHKSASIQPITNLPIFGTPA